jgi:2-polyprenyl-3-methyl-5-hydroxy-6-metoxy-1,4-benzoquinol methylase
LQRIRERASDAAVSITTIEAGEQSSNLPDGCYDAVVVRMVLHHLGNPAALARDLKPSLRAGDRVGALRHGNHRAGRLSRSRSGRT